MTISELTATASGSRTTQLASPVDIARYGNYRRPERPQHRETFGGRITADGSSGHRAEAGRYHLYAAWSCPWAHRATLEIAVNGLTEVIGVTYLDEERDGRGWAFRGSGGPDPVNGFRFLREAYEATEPGFDGHAGVPALWDRETGEVVSNDPRAIALDVATAFGGFRAEGVDTYPADRREEIDALDVWVGQTVNHGLGRASGTGPEADRARDALHSAFDRLEVLVGEPADGARFLVGDSLTEADIRLWVSLARYAARTDPPSAAATEQRVSHLGPPLSNWPRLSAYAGRLAALEPFEATTRWWALGGDGSLPASLAPSTPSTRSAIA